MHKENKFKAIVDQIAEISSRKTSYAQKPKKMYCICMKKKWN